MKNSTSPSFPRILAFLLPALAAVLTSSQTLASESSICQSAFETVKVTPFPKGYGISAEDQIQAMKYPQTRALLTALQSTIEVFEAVTDIAHGKIDVGFDVDATEDQLGFLNADDPNRRREFPEKFYRDFLARPDVKESAVRELYAIWSQGLGPETVSDEGLAILALVTRHRTTERQNNLTRDQVQEAQEQKLKNYLSKLKADGRLPQFGAFIGSSDALFVNYVTTMRGNVLAAIAMQTKNPSIVSSAMSDQQFRDALLSALRSYPNLDIEQKVHVAMPFIGPVEMVYLKKYFQSLTAPNSKKSNIERWNEAGVYFMSDIYRMAVQRIVSEAGPEAGNKLFRLTEADAAKAVDVFAAGADPKTKKILSDAISICYRTMTDLGGSDPKKSAARASQEFGMIVQRIKWEVNAAEKQERAAQRAALRAQIEQQGTAAPVVAPRSSHSSAVGQVPVETRAARRARMEKERREAERAAKAANEAAKAKASSPDAELPKLIDLELGSIVVGQRYTFSFNAETATEDIGSRDLQYVVFTKKFVNAFKNKNQNFKTWVKMFLMGRAPDTNSNGLKLLEGTKEINIVWEVKYLGPPFRAVVQQDKENRTWIWRGFVHHDDLTRFLRNAGL